MVTYAELGVAILERPLADDNLVPFLVPSSSIWLFSIEPASWTRIVLGMSIIKSSRPMRERMGDSFACDNVST